MIKTRVKIFTSTKGTLLEEKVNDELDRLEKEGYFIRAVDTDISFSGDRGYQSIATIVYEEVVYEDDNRDIGFNIDFGIGEPPAFDEGSEA